MVEHFASNERVAGSSPAVRSICSRSVTHSVAQHSVARPRKLDPCKVTLSISDLAMRSTSQQSMTRPHQSKDSLGPLPANAKISTASPTVADHALTYRSAPETRMPKQRFIRSFRCQAQQSSALFRAALRGHHERSQGLFVNCPSQAKHRAALCRLVQPSKVSFVHSRVLRGNVLLRRVQHTYAKQRFIIQFRSEANCRVALRRNALLTGPKP